MHCQTCELLSQTRSMPWISQACRINIYISEDWMWGMLLLVGEKAFVVFTVCVWAWTFLCVCVVTIHNVQVYRSETQITPDMCNVFVRGAHLGMTLPCSNLDLWCSVFCARLYVFEWVFRGEKDAFRYPAACTCAWKQSPRPLGQAAARMIEWNIAPPWRISLWHI